MADDPRRDDELSVEELDAAAGGLGDNTNCSQSCTSNSSCGPVVKEPTQGPIYA
ncbi:hypothetical protein [Longimicrobium sp.]|uniref:hypothetical protein n=1 Tax=Longimicrobium sp. TaxID=2029185 RepID=UPI002BE475C2|nr:hypothetical protein [Longimicrobium sp.]HSU15715.1 hypothetical protein [Longimicrobium sp.]